MAYPSNLSPVVVANASTPGSFSLRIVFNRVRLFFIILVLVVLEHYMVSFDDGIFLKGFTFDKRNKWHVSSLINSQDWIISSRR